MTPAPRFVRRAPPTDGLALQPRDRDVLQQLSALRYLRSDHIHELIFWPVSPRITRERLRKLWEHGLLERFIAPFVLAGDRPPAHAGQPVYALSHRGAELLARESVGEAAPGVPEPKAPATIEHHFVTIEFLVALTAAVRGRSDLVLVKAEHESTLWQQVAAFRGTASHRSQYLVPDAAVTLRFPPKDVPWTFYMEIVRADVRGGNQSLRKKMLRYHRLLRDGFFKTAYGHNHVRAIIFATTSATRVENLRRLAGEISVQKNIFWFGIYDARAHALTAFTAETICAERWLDAAGNVHSLLPPAQPSA